MGVTVRRKFHRLTAKAVTNIKTPGYIADGGGLYLQISPAITKSWVFRYTIAGKAREMGVGPLHTVTLAEARQKAADARKLLLVNVDPIAARDSRVASQALNAARAIPFDQCAAAYIKAHRAGWKNEKHIDQWKNTIRDYCGPVFGALPVQAVDTGTVLKALEPIWTSKPETASRLRGRIEKILDWATVRTYRTGDNPARWRGHLDKLLPRLDKRKRVKHHPALPFDDVGAFMDDLRAQDGLVARALELLILTATRTGEVIGAKWDEFDMDAALWTIPAERMKAHREHRIPLSPRAMKVLQGLLKTRQGDYVFPGRKVDTPISNMAMLELLKRMGKTRLTVHGFRSTFRDWAAERTSYPREVCEMALAHAIGDQVEAAYRRGDLFEKRRRLMADWTKHCDTARQSGKVVSLRRKKA